MPSLAIESGQTWAQSAQNPPTSLQQEPQATAQDPFDSSMQPIVYMSENRIPVIVEIHNAIICVIFAGLILTLLFLLPAIRRTKTTSFLGIATLLVMGASILLALCASSWLTGTVRIEHLQYKSMSRDTINGFMTIDVGLMGANVSLFGQLSTNGNPIDLNERIQWNHVDQTAIDHTEALQRGLPYPILTVTDYLAQDSDGFNWARQLRSAGYYSSLILHIALAFWCLTVVIMCALPSYLPHMIQTTAALMLLSVWLYTILIDSPKAFGFHVGHERVNFVFGFTYISTFVVGSISIFVGVLLLAIRSSKPHKELTALDSEKHIQDQKYLYNSTLWLTKQRSTTTSSTGSGNDSAIIPVGDIERAFAKNYS